MNNDLSDMYTDGIGEPQPLDRLTKLLIVLLVVGFIAGIVLANYFNFEIVL